MAKRGLFDRMRGRVERGVRGGLNQVMEGIQGFEDRGGMRGAVERAKVRGERSAAKIKEILEDRGIRVEIGRLMPPGDEERRALKAHYRTLDVPFGSDLESVKSAYRAKMRIHHPDRHAGDPEAEREATRISQELSAAYEAIEKHLKVR